MLLRNMPFRVSTYGTHLSINLKTFLILFVIYMIKIKMCACFSKVSPYKSLSSILYEIKPILFIPLELQV